MRTNCNIILCFFCFSSDVIGIPLAMFIVLWRNKKYLYVEEGKEATEKQKEVEFELGGLYAQCKFEREREQILSNDCYCFLEIISDVVCIFFPLLII